MKLLEMNLLQSFPVSNPNRDDSGSPKSVNFGGIDRARISSQCWNRAIRTYLRKSKRFQGCRTKLLLPSIKSGLISLGRKEEVSDKIARIFCSGVGGVGGLDKKHPDSLATMIYLSRQQLDNLCRSLNNVSDEELSKFTDKEMSSLHSEEEENGSSPKKAQKKGSKTDTVIGKIKASAKEIGSVVADGFDIAEFGRLFANDDSLSSDASTMAAHAFSTHEVCNEQDYFTAIDDLSDKNSSAHIGVSQFNSALYYRYHAVNLDSFFNHPCSIAYPEEARIAVEEYIEAVLVAMPSGCKSTKFAGNPPLYAKVMVREGYPITLANAFLSPVKEEGYLDESIRKLENHWGFFKRAYGITAESEYVMNPESGSLKELIKTTMKFV